MRISLCFVVLYACTVLPVFADDTSVEMASGLNGKLYLPEGTVIPTRIVLMLHGWNSHMDEVGNLYKDLASQLGVRGIASLRINFSGEGERVGYVVTSTFDSRIAETIGAYQYLRTKYPDAIVGVQGFSLGSLTAMAIAAEHPGPFLAIRGDQDYVPSNERKWFSLLPTKDKAFILVGGADHIFNVLDVPRPAYSERVIEATIDWFDRTLDL